MKKYKIYWKYFEPSRNYFFETFIIAESQEQAENLAQLEAHEGSVWDYCDYENCETNGDDDLDIQDIEEWEEVKLVDIPDKSFWNGMEK